MSATMPTHRCRGTTRAADRPAAPGTPRPGARPSDELTVEIVRRTGSTAVVAAGCLGREGGELLVALLSHAANGAGGTVTVDLRRVTHADPPGVAAVLGAGTVVDGTSAAVDRALGALVR